MVAMFLAANGDAQTKESPKTEPAATPDKQTIGVPEDLEVILLPNQEIKKIDKPYTVTVILNNPTQWPIKCEESFDFVAGFDAKTINIEVRAGDKPRLKATKIEGFFRKQRQTKRLSKPLIIAPARKNVM